MPAFFLMVIALAACNKTRTVQKIDVSNQCIKYDVGGGTCDSVQWKPVTYTAAENNLFTSLDTADLTGTISPDTIQSTKTQIGYNPFSDSTFLIRFVFCNGYTNEVVLKYVVVDSLMTPLVKGTWRVRGDYFQLPSAIPSISNYFVIPVSAPKGRYRLYYSLSAFANKNFYTCWGNIESGN
jgi:hypothetical protein